MRAANLCCPELDIVACKDLRVLQGIRLDRFQDGGDGFTLCCRQTSESNGKGPVLALDLPGRDNTSYYTALVELADQRLGPDQASMNQINDRLVSWAWDSSEIYNSKLFHGPDFHVIRSLEGVSDEAATAILAGTPEKGRPGGLWKTDVAALDGGLQLAILWGLHVLGRQSLPTRIESCAIYHEGLVSGPVRCELESRSVRNDRTVSDISFLNHQGQLVAKMCGVEMHMLPDAGSEG